MKEKEIKLYLRKIKRYVVCKNENMRRMLGELEASLFDYADSHPDATVIDIKAHFGDAKAIADSFNAELDRETIRKYRFGRSFIIGVIAIIVAILLCFGVIEIIVAINNYRHKLEQENAIITYTYTEDEK